GRGVVPRRHENTGRDGGTVGSDQCMAGSELIFISGGVRSGKSAYAEKLIREHGSSERLYLASGQKGDAEMDERIHKHRRDRQFDGWTTIEAQVKFERVVE